MRALPKAAIAVVAASLLSACGGGDDGGSLSAGNNITGTLRVTAGTTLATRLINLSVAADIGGLTPAGAGVTVQLVRLGNQGQNPAVLATTTTDSSGAYSFTGGSIPAPASNLAVQVVGQSTAMQALVTGSTVDISPASEAVFEEVTGSSGVSLANFTLEELTALNGVVLGTGLDLSNDNFAEAVTALKTASGSVLTTLVTQFNAAGLITDLQNRSYNTVGTLSTLSAAPSPGIGLASRYGQGLIDATNAMTNSSLEAVIAPLTENLNTLGNTLNQGAAGTDVSLEGWIHMPTSTGQLVVSDPDGNGAIGAVNAANSFIVYPLTANTPVSTPYTTLTRGLRIITQGYTPAGPGAAGSSPFANSDLDAGGTGTTYHLLQLSQTLASNSGQHSGLGDQITATTAVGDVVLTNATSGPSFQNQGPYGILAANSLSTDNLTLDLNTSTISPQSGTGAIAGTSGGYYYVSPFGNLTLRDNATGNPILGVGNVVPGGEIFAFALTPDDQLGPPFTASLNGVGAHTLGIAVRQNTNPVTLSAGTYNVIKYAYYLKSGTVVGSGYQTGTVTVAGDGTIQGGSLIRSEGDISVPTALSDPTTALTTSSSTAPETASGSITLGSGDNTATLSATIGPGTGETLTGTGAITADGSIAVFAIDVADSTSSDPIGRGLLFLIRQP